MTDERLAGAAQPTAGEGRVRGWLGPVRLTAQLVGGEPVPLALHVLVNKAQEHGRPPRLPMVRHLLFSPPRLISKPDL